MSATINEFVMVTEYILYHGNTDVILCERGIRNIRDSLQETLWI